jgi:hypothetical protein
MVATPPLAGCKEGGPFAVDRGERRDATGPVAFDRLPPIDADHRDRQRVLPTQDYPPEAKESRSTNRIASPSTVDIQHDLTRESTARSTRS